MEKITIGMVATRRNVFSKEEAKRFKNIVKEQLAALPFEIIDIDDINEEGLLYDEKFIPAIVEKMKAANVDGMFIPHCNFGSEMLVSEVCRQIEKPVLLWAPRDDAPTADGTRTRDSQCGLFATGKVLRRFNVPYTYLNNTAADSEYFLKGFADFCAVCAAVKAFKNTRVLQIDTRPQAFWTMIVNEGELLEKFGIKTIPITLADINWRMLKVLEEKGEDYEATLERVRTKMNCCAVTEEDTEKIAALKVAMKQRAEELNCNAIAVQCWDDMQDLMGIMPCVSNGLLTEEGLPVVCETDIHGAATARMISAATLGTTIFFADLTVRHPENNNAELLWHCGNFPLSLKAEDSTAEVFKNVILPSKAPGLGGWRIKDGEITIARFDGDHGEYKLFIGEGKSVPGPKTNGTYVWFEVDNWAKWEKKLVTGPYVHHCAGAYGNVGHILKEACKYIPGLTADPATCAIDEMLEDRWIDAE